MKRILAMLVALALCLISGAVCLSEEEVLTTENCPELVTVLQVKNEFDDAVKSFAQNFKDRVIEFDGNIAYLANHESYKTRYDILIGCGDYGAFPMRGPNFQFSDVAIYDLGLSESWSSDSIEMGMNVRVRARIVEYNNMNGLFILDPVSLEERDSAAK